MFAYCGNNPINLVDTGGNTPDSAISLFGLIPLLPFIDGPLPVGDVVAIVLLFGAIAVEVNARSKKKEVQELAQDVVVVQLRNETYESYTVYFLCKSGDLSKDIVYVGRVKTDNLDSRMSYHSSKGRELVGYVSGLTYEECRILEQLGMAHFHSIARGDPLHNQIRGVAEPKMGLYIIYAIALAQSGQYPEDGIFPLSYLMNQCENYLLNCSR